MILLVKPEQHLKVCLYTCCFKNLFGIEKKNIRIRWLGEMCMRSTLQIKESESNYSIIAVTLIMQYVKKHMIMINKKKRPEEAITFQE